jgi:hypothetical protein
VKGKTRFEPKQITTALLAAALMCFCLPGCNGTSTPEPAPMESEVESEQEAVYAAAFDEIYGEPRMYVLREMSEPGIEGVDGLEAETLEDFARRNETEMTVGATMELGLPYVILGEDEFNEIFNINTSGWDLFYTRFPNSPGMTTVSQVGFNQALDQALVYVGTISNWLAGWGVYLLLEKQDGG